MVCRIAAAALSAAAGLLAAAGPSRAQDDPQIEACHQLSTADMSPCFDKFIQQWDRRLNAAYQKALKTVDPAGVPALRAAERAWLEYRKDRCTYLSAGPGTIGSVIGRDCMVRMLKTRALELEEDSKGLGPG